MWETQSGDVQCTPSSNAQRDAEYAIVGVAALSGLLLIVLSGIGVYFGLKNRRRGAMDERSALLSGGLNASTQSRPLPRGDSVSRFTLGQEGPESSSGEEESDEVSE